MNLFRNTHSKRDKDDISMTAADHYKIEQCSNESKRLKERVCTILPLLPNLPVLEHELGWDRFTCQYTYNEAITKF